MFNGYKTYVAAGAMFVFALYGLITNKLDQNQAIEMILEAAAIVGLRNAVS